MLPLNEHLTLVLWILVGVASVGLAVLSISLEENLRYMVRRVVPAERRKGGRPPTPKSRALWTLFAGMAAFVVIGTAVASSASGSDREEEQRARDLVAADVREGLRRVDTQYGLLDELVSRELCEARERKRCGQPGRNGSGVFLAALGYQKMLAANEVAMLREQIRQLALPAALPAQAAPALLRSGADAERIRAYYTRLEEVTESWENLAETFAHIATVGIPDEGSADHYRRRIAWRWDQVRNRSEAAYAAGTVVLASLSRQGGDESLRLVMHNLVPAPAEKGGRGRPSRAEQLEAEKEALHARGESLLLEADSMVQALLQVRNTDGWAEVVGKALSLRNFGRTNEAVAAFVRYGEMFSAGDPTAPQYSRTAQAFTRAFTALGGQPGMYVYDLSTDGSAWAGGVRVGDIIMDVNGRPTRNAQEFAATQEGMAAGTAVILSVLRLSGGGSFTRLKLQAVRAPMGVNVMPI